LNAFWKWFDAEARPKLADRAETFAAMFSYLDTFKRSVRIVETGCVREPGNWSGDGCSTIMFDRYVQAVGGFVFSVDIDPEATKLCTNLVSGRVTIHTGDSVAWLKQLAISVDPSRTDIDLVYLDSFDLLRTQPIKAATHHINELMAILPAIRADTLVVVDDSPTMYDDTLMPRNEITGKGMFISQYAQEVGAELLFSRWQVGWIKMVAPEKEPSQALADLIERARAYVEASRNVDADTCYRLILGRCTPPGSGAARIAYGEACLFYARLALTKGKYGTASDWYRESLVADPLAVDYRLEMALRAYMPMGSLRLAQQEAAKATRIEPDYPQAWKILGMTEMENGNAKACIAAYDRQLELAPESPDAMLDRMTIAMDVEDYELVGRLCEEVLKTDRAADATHVLAMVAYRQGNHEIAADLYQKAIDGGCFDQASAHWNRSLALHALGRYREGWIEHEYRKDQKHSPALSMPLKRFVKPLWTGKELPPASVHVHCEAGLGDQIAMVRYLKLMADRGYDVRYEAHEGMVDLVQRSFPEVKVVPKAADYPGAIGLPMFDYHLPIGSLPAVFETDVNTVPWFGAYLKADSKLGECYDLPKDRRKIGLCWSSGIRDTGIWIAEYGRRKSMHFDTLVPIAQSCPRDFFVSLQVGPEREQIPYAWSELDMLPENPSWDDTAALIECLDLVITVDTSIAHLAGAMGKPTWLMMHTEGSWHWMAERPGSPWNTRSPWYPSVRIYRQKTAKEWGDVIARIADDLAEPKKVRRVV
jgi:tetratricopeptide (TPR) repeat protein